MKGKSKTALEADLRQRAEEALVQWPASAAGVDPATALHELRVRQVELEMQNEALRAAQAELAESRDRYAELYDFAPVGLLTLAADGRIQELNLAAAELLGMGRDSLRGKRFLSMLALDDRAEWARHLVGCQRDGGTHHIELELWRGDGETLQARLQCTCRTTGAGKGVMRVGLTDISARRRAEAAACNGRQLRQAILDCLDVSIAVLDRDGIIVAVNAAWTRFARDNSGEPGRDAEHTGTGTDYLAVCAAATGHGTEGAREAGAGIHTVLAGHAESFRMEYPCHCTGEQRWFAMSVTPLRVPGGGAVVAHREITRRKVDELRWRASEDRFRSFFNSGIDAMFLAARSGQILETNPAAQRLFGYTEDEFRLIGRQGLVDASDPRLLPAIAQRDAHGYFRGELAFIAKDGTRIPVDISSSVYRGSQNDLLTTIVVRDIRPRLRRESELGILRRELGALLEWQIARQTVQAMAHELNQPLASIAVLCEAVRRMATTGQTGQGTAAGRLDQALQRIEFESLQASKVVKDLMASIEGVSPAPGKTSLPDLLAQIEMAARSADFGDCRLQIVCAADVHWLQAGPLQLEKVLLNLIRNSVEAMQAAGITAGCVWVRAEQVAASNEVRITVRDEGPGIDEHTRHQLFHPFVSTKKHGLGMGLSICRALVEMQGGRIWHESTEAPGATFRLTLPCAR